MQGEMSGNKVLGRTNSFAVVGIDVGSATAKAAVVDANGRLLSYSIIQSGVMGRNPAIICRDEALTRGNLHPADIRYTVATGYGRNKVDFADKAITEISCHARGVYSLFPEARTVIDIGGQDSKVIGIDGQGCVTNFTMNDKCAAGTGRFLEVMSRAMGIEVSEMGGLGLRATGHIHVSSICTVFAESEVISLLAEGWDKTDVIAGIHEAIARRMLGLIERVGLRQVAVMTGGVAKNKGVVRALEALIGVVLAIPFEPQITGALGGALYALESATGYEAPK